MTQLRLHRANIVALLLPVATVAGAASRDIGVFFLGGISLAALAIARSFCS